MKNLKKVLSVLLVVAMLAVTMVPAFAAESATISADAKICSDIGMLIGEGAGVTADYTSTTPTRAQAAVMLLRLKGLAADAAKFEGKDNFADVEDMEEWFVPYAAYLKATPTVGFVGVEDGKFAADLKITAQEYYKVVLTALGYEVGAGKDYEYDKTLEFAATKGLKLVADATEFTVDNVATATVEALKATVKGGTKTLATVLVEAGKLDAVKATAAGLYTKYAALDVNSVSSYTNTKIKVSLNSAVTAVDVAKIAIKDEAGTALEVNAATLSADGKIVFVSTAAQTSNILYVVTIEGKDFKFVGLAADGDKPKLTQAVALKNTKVEVQFNETMDTSALNIVNYAIDGLTVLKAEFKADTSNKVVILTTSSQSQGVIYKVVVTNATDVAGNVINAENDEFQFGGLAPDTEKPKLSSAVALTNTSVKATFSEELDKVTAENIANYAIDGLSILKAELQSNKLDVNLTTSAQTQGTIYKLVVTNVTDEYANVINSENDEFQFGGLAPDTEKPKLESAVSLTNTSVKLTFTEEVEKTTAENIANYAIDGLTILKAVKDGKTVTLTTSAQTQGTIYKVVVTNVTDLSANVVNAENDEFQFGGLAADTTKPTVKSATAVANTKVIVEFSEAISDATGSLPYNYYLGSTLGYPTKVEKITDAINTEYSSAYAKDGSVWLLTVKSMSAAAYTVDVTGVQDLSGNVLNEDSDTFTFGGISADTNDTTAPKVSSAVALDKNTIVVTFNEAMNADSISSDKFEFSVNSGTVTDKVYDIAEGTFDQLAVKKVSDDKKSVTLQFANKFTQTGVVYKVKVTNVLDSAGNVIKVDADNTALFAGISTANPAPKVTSAVLLNNQTLKITFSEPVSISGTIDSSDFAFSVAAFTGVFNKSVLSSDKTSLTIYYKDDSDVTTETGNTDKFTMGILYTVTINNNHKIKDAVGVVELLYTDSNAKGTFAGISSSVSAPKISAIIAIDVNTIDVIFDQAIVDAEFASIVDSVSVTASVYGARKEGSDNNKIRVFFAGTPFTPGSVYKVTLNEELVSNNNGKAMLAADNNKSFAAISTANAAPKLSTAIATNATTIRVTFSEIVAGTISEADFAGITVTGITKFDGKTYDLTVSDASMVSGTLYTLSVVANSGITDEYGVADVDISATVKFSGK